MGTNTGLGIGIGIPFKNNALGGDKPYFPPELKARMIGVWDNYGKKNTDADRNIIKNKIPNAGGDLEILNAAYRLNSGFGGYSNDFQEYSYNENVIVKDNTNAIFNNNGQLLIPYSSMTKNIPSFKIKVSGLSETYHFRYYYRDSKGVQYSINMAKNGNYELPICYNIQSSSDGVHCGFANFGNDIVTVEILPEFEDAFVSDGINDMIISQKTIAEMGITDKVTIVSMIHQITLNTRYNIGFTNYIESLDGTSYVRNKVYDIDKVGIYGYSTSLVKASASNINNILGDKKDYNVEAVNQIKLDNAKFSVIARVTSFGEVSSVAHYWTFAVLGEATEDEINLIIGNYNLDRSLKPDILCNIGKQGITNDNHAEFNDKLIDYSGNGRDIQMNNLAWKGGSGIAAKPYETFKDWLSDSSSTSIITQIDEFTRIVDSTTNGYWISRIRRDSDLDKVYDPITTYLYQDDNRLIHECKYKVDGVDYTIPIYENVGKGYHQLEIYTKDRYTELPENAENIVLSEWYFPKSTKGSIKYSVIPSHKGGIILDGIIDFGKVIGMPIYKDYTFIIDRQIISIGGTAGVVASKSEDSTDVNKQGAFLFEYLGAPNNISTWSFYKDNGKVANTDFTRGISYQSTYSYNGKDLTIGTSKDSDKLWLGTIRDRDSRFFNGVIYSLMSFSYSMNKFLIERQLKKHKLGTLYPNMVEFRPVIKSSVELASKPTFVIRGTSTLLNAGDYIPENSEIWISIKMNNAADRITKFVVNGKIINIPENAYNETSLQYGFSFIIDSKSPQKITMTIEQDENYVQWNPVITSNVKYVKLDFYTENYQKRINIGDYIPKGIYLRANFYLKNNVDELTRFTFNGVNIGYKRSVVDDTAYNIDAVYNYDSPQEINITIDEYIRYEDIVQPYPSFYEFIDENRNLVTWGSKIKVGSTITRTKSFVDSNLLKGLYTISYPKLNGVEASSSKYVVEKSMIFTCTATWTFDNNEPKSILSPRLLRIPNSSYKILGYIPDISGHGNHGNIKNSAYTEDSGAKEDGSWQFDGVEDYVILPTITGGKQVLMKVNWQDSWGNLIYDQRSAGQESSFAILIVSNNDNVNNKIAYQGRNAVGSTYIDGIKNEYIESYTLNNITHNITIVNNTNSNRTPVLGSSNRTTPDYFSKYALYDFMCFDEISEDNKIEELNKYIGIEAKVELPPYYWDAYGKTNSDEDKATIKQRGIAVGDYDLTNYNHAYEGMSGYNGYPVVFGTGKTWIAEGTKEDDMYYIYTRTSTKYNITQIKFSSSLFYTYIKRNGELTSNNKDIPSFKLKVTGLDYDRFYLTYYYLKSTDVEVKNVFNILSDGIYELPKSFASNGSLTETDSYIGLSFIRKSTNIPDVISNVNVIIEVLPEYENGLVYDGVEDYSKNANIPAFTDYTYIYKRTIINIPTNAATLLKGTDKTNGGAFIADYGNKWQFNFGQYNTIQSIIDGINWQTINSFNGTSINKGENTDDSGITVSKFSNGYAIIVFYKLILYPKTISLLEINFLKNLMAKDGIIDLTYPIFIEDEGGG